MFQHIKVDQYTDLLTFINFFWKYTGTFSIRFLGTKKNVNICRQYGK